MDTGKQALGEHESLAEQSRQASGSTTSTPLVLRGVKAEGQDGKTHTNYPCANIFVPTFLLNPRALAAVLVQHQSLSSRNKCV